jgi:hypothetical protein
MNARTSPFRGYRGIELIAQMMAPMVEWLLKYKPESRHLTLTRKDYDLIVRWPKAGKMLGFEYTAEGLVTYKGIVLGYDKRPGRYSESAKACERE